MVCGTSLARRPWCLIDCRIYEWRGHYLLSQGNKMTTFGEAKLLSAERHLWKSRALTTKRLFVSLNSDLTNSRLMASSCVCKTA